MKIKVVFFATLVADNNAGLNFSLQSTFKCDYWGLNFVPSKADVANLQFSWSRRLGKLTLKIIFKWSFRLGPNQSSNYPVLEWSAPDVSQNLGHNFRTQRLRRNHFQVSVCFFFFFQAVSQIPFFQNVCISSGMFWISLKMVLVAPPFWCLCCWEWVPVQGMLLPTWPEHVQKEVLWEMQCAKSTFSCRFFVCEMQRDGGYYFLLLLDKKCRIFPWLLRACGCCQFPTSTMGMGQLREFLDHRIMEWPVLGGTIKFISFQPLTMSRDTFEVLGTVYWSLLCFSLFFGSRQVTFLRVLIC